MRGGGFLQVWKTRLGQGESAAHVDLLHQIEPLERQVFGLRDIQHACVVDDDVYAAEVVDGGIDHPGDVVVVPDVTDNGYGVSAQLVQFCDGGMNRPGQSRVGGIGLGEQDDVSTAARDRAGNGKSDATTSPGHDGGSPAEACGVHCDPFVVDAETPFAPVELDGIARKQPRTTVSRGAVRRSSCSPQALAERS